MGELGQRGIARIYQCAQTAESLEKERCLPGAGTMTWQIERDGQR